MADAGALQVVTGVATVVLVVFMLAGVVAVWSFVRASRRRYRRLRMTLAGLSRASARSALLAGAGARVVSGVAALPVADMSWWATQRDRHRMWRAVTAADRPVATAVAADAPVGDLAVLTRRLRKTAASVDAAMRASGRSTALPDAVRRQVVDVVRAADDVRDAAVEALAAVAQPATSALTDAVRTEVAALRHGLATIPAGRRASSEL